MSHETPPCSFEWSDRVDHRIFGLGTVTGDPMAGIGATKYGHETEFKGWRIPVTWDDPGRGSFAVMDYTLRVTDRPGAKGGAFWSSEYGKLVSDTQSARKNTDQAFEKAFRRPDGNGVAGLLTLLETERAAIGETIASLEADERGDYP